MKYTKKELIAMCKERNIKGYSGKNKKEIIDLLKTHNISIINKKEQISKQKYSCNKKENKSLVNSKKESLLKDPTNTGHEDLKIKNNKKNNGKNEVRNIELIIDHLNQITPLGKKLIKKLEEEFGIILNYSENRKGNRNSHYDFKIVDTNNKEYQVEHKGSYKNKRIATQDKPWKSGVQFLNGGAEKFSICKIYAKLWFDTYIESMYLSNLYNIESQIPTFNNWFKSDCCCQGDPKTAFSKELKSTFRNRNKNGPKSLIDLRENINILFLEEYKNDESIQRKFKEELDIIVKDVLKEKHLWLQINGDLSSEDVSFQWYKQMSYNKITNIKISYKTDINIIVETDKFNFNAILRWGKGAGFSNLRIDSK
tara:strand:+ start:83 stop:1186 length:1104 start_codon:yes stop_codon:yes gene_type:complete